MKNDKKINKTRKQRGYAFETEIVKKFQALSGWDAKRLGSPSTELPDAMALNNYYKTIIAVEAKSTVGSLAYVPQDQVQRCIDWVDTFSIYDEKKVVLAFKFGRTLLRNKKNPERNKLRYFYKVYPHKNFTAAEVKANYDGKTWVKENDEWVPLVMQELKII